MAKKKQQQQRRQTGRGDDVKPYTMRLTVEVMDQVDELAQELNLSRQAVVDKLLAMSVHSYREFRRGIKDGGGLLFQSVASDLEAIVQEAVKRAVREGGIDLASVHRKKGGR